MPVLENTEDIRSYATEQGVSEAEARQRDIEEESTELVEKGAEVYANG